jgi:hypothetical protein
MKVKVLVILLFVLSMISIPSASAVTEQCNDRWYWVDDITIWCVPDGWYSWSAQESDATELQSVLSEFYINITVDNLMHLDSATMVSVMLHEPIDNFIVTAQVFVEGYDDSYSSPEELIADFELTVENERYEYALETNPDTGNSLGFIFEENPQDGYSRLWAIYPFEELDRVYTIALFAPTSAWENEDTLYDLMDILFSFRILEDDGSSSGSTQQNGNQFSVWVGGQVTQIYSESGNGDPNNAFGGALWEFHPNGTVSLTPDGIGTKVRSDLFPVTGQYTAEGGTTTFVLEKQLSDASLLVLGTLDVDSGLAEIKYQVSFSIVDTLNNMAMTNTYDVHFQQQFVR